MNITDLKNSYQQQPIKGIKRYLNDALSLVGQKFGSIEVIGLNPIRKNEQYQMDVFCHEHPELGIYSVLKGNLISGNTKGCIKCGPLKGQAGNRTHGKSSTHEYYAFNRIVGSITNPNYPCYDRYGGRGLDMDPRYDPKNTSKLEAFQNFCNDLIELNFLPIPKGFSIDRIDNNKGYWKNNLRLATIEEQQQNTRNNVTNPEEVKQMRQLWNTGNYTQIQIGQMFNVSSQVVYEIVNFRSWKNI